MIPSGPVYALDTDESYKTQLTTAFHAERVAKGNATVSVYVKAVNSSDAFKFVRNDYYSWVSVLHAMISANGHETQGPSEGLFTQKNPRRKSPKKFEKSKKKIQKIQGFLFEDLKSLYLIWD